ncbi:MAG TPA: elongation factor G, partial [Chitinophagaceae bacterium]|nr:elongation factor G [Chitinophagaceae bacterium]
KLGNVDEGNTMMDTDPQEEKRGITISSAAITTYWNYSGGTYQVNIIDTPGHVDFTAEVERSLRVLEGAVAVLCARAGVQPQSETVWHQANRYGIPRLVLINKMDRQGADFHRVVREIRQQLHANAIPVQLPIGAEDAFSGVIDLITMKAWVWNSYDGKTYEVTDIPLSMQEEALEGRKHLLEELSLLHEGLFDMFISDPGAITEAILWDALREATIRQLLVPVLCGAAYRNKGMQPLLDAVVRYLPAPEDVPFITGTDPYTGEEVRLPATGEAPLSGLVFKTIANEYTGKLTLVRVYSGTLRTGDTLWNSRMDKKVRVSRLMRIMSDKYETVEEITAGDIGAMVGLKDVRTGDTLSDPGFPVVLEKMQFPEPMIGYAIEAKNAKESGKLGEALYRLLEEDPTLVVETDTASGQTILKGMGELHLDVVLEKLYSGYQLEINKGQPRIAYKEVFTQEIHHKEVFKKQNGGSGNFAEIHFSLSPRGDGMPGLQFIDEIKGGAIPREFIASVNKGFEAAMNTGVLAGYPVQSMCVRLFDGTIHDKDSHAQDFEQVAEIGFRTAASRAIPKLLEPIMCVDVAMPEEYTGMVTGDLNRRRGIIKSVEMKNSVQCIRAEVPLSELFGYITVLRTITSGRASASMTFHDYQLVPEQAARKIAAG